MTAGCDIDDADLLARIRRHDEAAWEAFIARFQGRLLAFAAHRLSDPAAAEDVVQETFLGFLLALPNYDDRTPLEAFLFSIAAHKLIDALRRRGIRPRLLPTHAEEAAPGIDQRPGSARKASSLARSREDRVAKERVLGECLARLVQQWISRGEFERLKCIELLFVAGYSNKEAAQRLGISEQAVANHKAFVVQKLKEAATAARLRGVEFDSLKR
uniref:Sigma-70 family RNA polymerase sigma factor n=1 Tax=Schlesneria paludicola TaxID=360056 RepID=A0A7C4QTL0_9PLAN